MESPLKHWRERKGIKQSDLAYSANIAQSHVTEAEKGRVILGEKLEALLRLSPEGEKVIELHVIYMEYVKQKLVSRITKG